MKIGICGHITSDLNNLGGQSIKTKQVLNALKIKNSDGSVTFLNSSNWKKNPFIFILKLIKLHRKNEIIVFITAHNGLKVFPRILNILNKFRKRKLHYLVVGGWLSNSIDNNPNILKALRKLNGIHVETLTMKKSLEKYGLGNVVILENFRNHQVMLNQKDFVNEDERYNFCFFSRVIKEKGIEDLIDVINTINTSETTKKCYLDIYGPISPSYLDEIASKIDNKYINYKGIVKNEDSVNVLGKYFMQIFPTKYFTEGIPGSIVESYFAGLPVIASKWESFNDVMIEGITGIGYEFNDKNDLENKILWAINNEEKIIEMRKSCLEVSKQYQFNNVVDKFIQNLKGEKNGD